MEIHTSTKAYSLINLSLDSLSGNGKLVLKLAECIIKGTASFRFRSDLTPSNLLSDLQLTLNREVDQEKLVSNIVLKRRVVLPGPGRMATPIQYSKDEGQISMTVLKQFETEQPCPLWWNLDQISMSSTAVDSKLCVAFIYRNKQCSGEQSIVWSITVTPEPGRLVAPSVIPSQMDPITISWTKENESGLTATMAKKSSSSTISTGGSSTDSFYGSWTGTHIDVKSKDLSLMRSGLQSLLPLTRNRPNGTLRVLRRPYNAGFRKLRSSRLRKMG